MLFPLPVARFADSLFCVCVAIVAGGTIKPFYLGIGHDACGYLPVWLSTTAQDNFLDQSLVSDHFDDIGRVIEARIGDETAGNCGGNKKCIKHDMVPISHNCVMGLGVAISWPAVGDGPVGRYLPCVNINWNG